MHTKSSLWDLDLSIKRSRPFPSDLKKYYKQGKLLNLCYQKATFNDF